jgi:hypothetical protein
MDWAERDVQHLIMLGVLTAQSADEPAPLAPRNPHRLHFANQPCVEDLAPEESPSLAVRPASVPPPLGRRPRSIAQRRHPFGVGPRKLPEPDVQDDGNRAVQVSSIAVLDDLLQFRSEGGREFDRVDGSTARAPDQRPYRIRAVRKFVRCSELFEERLFLSAEAHAEKVGRGSCGPSIPHAFNTI